MGQKPRSAPRDVPDSLPRRDQGTDVLPDDVRRTDRPPQLPPDSLPESEEEKSADGGVGQHPIHDSDEEDGDAQDYEDEIAEVAKVDSAVRS
jgi:hypothetical protein